MYDAASREDDRAIVGLRAAYADGRTREPAWRRGQLEGVLRFCRERETDIADALMADLGKGLAETLSSELSMVVGEARHALKNLSRWMEPRKVDTPFVAQPGRSWIAIEPRGVVLIIGAWNMPIAVTLAPLIAALAAGNAVALKPSELAPRTSSLLANWLPKYLDVEAIRVVEGGREATETLLADRWDHIFYTGGTAVGRKIAEAAARHLTPVTLELGGKNPAYVHASADLKVTARRLTWAKWMNAGQVCVSPDYVLVDASVRDRLVAELITAVNAFFGEVPIESPDYARIVSARHFDRLAALATDAGGDVALVCASDRERLRMGPCLIIDPDPASSLMTEEIFGPILPIRTVAGPAEAAELMGERSSPLVVHVFASDASVISRMQDQTRSGAFLVNDAIISHAVRGLPFGGVGDSGIGAYHGRHGFETFSHARAVFQRPTGLDNPLRYPPHTPSKTRWIRRFTGLNHKGDG